MTIGIDIEYRNLFLDKPFRDLIDNPYMVNSWNVFVDIDGAIRAWIMDTDGLKDGMGCCIFLQYMKIKGNFII
jgi:hypothetical protein